MSAGPATTAAPLGHYLRLILRGRLRAAWRRLRRRRLGLAVTAGVLVATAVVSAGLAMAGFGIGRLLRLAAGIDLDPTEVLASERLVAELAGLSALGAELPLLLPNAIFLGGWLALFFLSFASLLGTLYLRRDLPLLMVAPVPIRAVFVAQFLEALLVPLFWTLALALPALWGFGLAMRYGFAYFALALLLLVLLPLVPLALAALFTLLLLRLVPAPRATEILTLVGTLLGVGIWLGSQSFGAIVRAVDPAGQALVRSGLGLAQPFLPWAWGARSMVGAGVGNALTAVGFGALYAALSLGSLAASMAVAERVYYDGWVQGDRASGRSRSRRAPRAAGADWLPPILPRPAVAIARKDWRLMRRDPRGYSSLIWIFAMLGFWVWRLAQPESGGEVATLFASGLGATFGSLAPVGLALVLSGMRWGLESISRDQQAFQVVRAAPVAPWHIVLGKWLSTYVPSLLLAAVVLVVFSVPLGLLQPGIVARNLLILLPLLAGETAIMVALGSVRPNFDWADPRQMTGTLDGCLGAVLTWSYLGVTLVIVAFGLAAPVILGWPAATAWIAWSAVTGLSLLIMAVAFGFASRRLAAVEL